MQFSQDPLLYLAGLYGIQTSYLDMNCQVKPASREALLAVLKALGAPLQEAADIPSAIRYKNQQQWQLPLEPVLVAWENDILKLNLRLPSDLLNTRLAASLILENGQTREFTWLIDSSSILQSAVVEGRTYLVSCFSLPDPLPVGYHKLKLFLPGRVLESLIISAPLIAYSPPAASEKIWGAFLPLYALHSQNSWGAGDLSDLSRFLDWISGLGGRMAGTLPLLPSFFDAQTGPGPYLPASRLFWNEFYLDIHAIPELSACRPAQELIRSETFQNTISHLQSTDYVNYPEVLSLKRRVLEELTQTFFTQMPDRFSEFQSYLASHPALADYAAFRAAGEKYGIDWHLWPEALRNAHLPDTGFAESAYQYHLYTQWLVQEQIDQVFQKARRNNLYLYLDLPVGVHPYSYDVWRERDSFVPTVNGGAPPDPVFTSGQNWSFPPLHPENIRSHGYAYFIACLRHHVRQAGMLRIDHMMNFHRLFWIPRGMENREGVYVNYPAEELYAILTLESCRHRSVIIGEDLGMVPPEVRPMMDQHGLFRMFVGQYALIAENQIGNIPPRSVASLNTHDMFPFAAFWQESDIPARRDLHLVSDSEAALELGQRQQVKKALINLFHSRGFSDISPQDPSAALQAILILLARSPAYGLLVNLEDLWLETAPQNVPGLRRDHNWSHKARYSLEEICNLQDLLVLLRKIDQSRRERSLAT